MDWFLLGVSVALPLNAIIRFSFERREKALEAIASLKAHSLQIYLAHSTWDWINKSSKNSSHCGRKSSKTDFLLHSDKCYRELVAISDELLRYLSLPTSTFGRHHMIFSSKNEALHSAEAQYLIFDSVLARRMTKLAKLCEDLKRAGLSPSEASRIRQSERFLCQEIENLCMLKSYRTPNALRAFSNFFSILIPPL